MSVNRRVVIRQLPRGKLTADDFRIEEGPMPALGEGQALVRTLYVAVDAAGRAWMMGPTYRSALNAGDVMAGAALAEVIESRAESVKPGDLVYAETGWQDYAVLSAASLVKTQPVQPLTHLMSVYGVAGLTAHLGLMECGAPKAGETVVVSAAAGAVGSIAGQIAKAVGCRTVGIAGGKAKCERLTAELGFDAAVDYKAGNLYQALMDATGGGADIFFDNVGGDVFESMLFAMKPFGRIVCCGAVSAYDGTPMQAVRGVPGWLVSRRLSMRGFIVSDLFSDGRREKALAELQNWVKEGRLRICEDVIDGLEALPAALVGLLAGENVGKRMVKVAS